MKEPESEVGKLLAEIFAECLEVVDAKNHDYGDSWKDALWIYSPEDIRTRTGRLRQLYRHELRGEETRCAEGIESELKDIINMSALGVLTYRARHNV